MTLFISIIFSKHLHDFFPQDFLMQEVWTFSEYLIVIVIVIVMFTNLI